MGQRVLLLDADESFRNNLAMRLRREGHKVWEADGWDDLREALGKGAIEVVLLGLSGFGREGLEFLRFLRQRSPETPVVLINRHQRIDLSIDGMKLGAFDEHLLPVDLKALEKSINEARKMRDRLRDGSPLPAAGRRSWWR